ncbi:ATP-binding cassette domain-containing protein [Streptomyces phaeolivaceus]|uniref:ATP-binding cassette domain-containing protein n=1 Tax=Streptomyces phaeolivaceus TaxID=2653200 RepID=UPI001D03ECD2|nr:ATP-binding cassette domain-containing protein [Streptomyces phaeolivaceus]
MSAVSAADLAPTPYAWEIRATGLKVRVGRKRMAVDGLDLSLGTGVHGLLGPNGAGKTTLIRALATVLRPAEGSLELLGESTGGLGEHRALRRRIGYLPQEFGYYKRFTVREFVEYMAWLKEVPKADIPAAVRRAVERVGLADRADDRMKTLCGARYAWTPPVAWLSSVVFAPTPTSVPTQVATWMLLPPGTAAATWTAVTLAITGTAAYALAGPRR